MVLRNGLEHHTPNSFIVSENDISAMSKLTNTATTGFMAGFAILTEDGLMQISPEQVLIGRNNFV